MSLTTAILIIVGVILLGCFVFVVPYVTYRMAFRRAKNEISPYDGLDKPSADSYREKSRELIDKLLSTKSETLYMSAKDGTRLCAEYYAGEYGAPLDIQCHGYRSTPFRDFSGGALESMKKGRHVLMIYQRAHGKSEGKSISFGLKESYDLVEWTDFMLQRLGKDTPVLYTGISMGGATVLLASALDLPKNVKCIIADCPYSDTKAIIKSEIRKMHLPKNIAYFFVRLGALLFADFDPDLASPKQAVKSARVPILLLHGEEDRFVPTVMSEEIRASAASRCVRHTFPGARHGTSYLIDTKRYMTEVDRFVRECGVIDKK